MSSTLLRQQLQLRAEGTRQAEEGEGTLIYLQGQWLNTAAEPPGTGWIQYGFDFFRYRTSESSPTIW